MVKEIRVQHRKNLQERECEQPSKSSYLKDGGDANKSFAHKENVSLQSL
jgi:hypothetical protein